MARIIVAECKQEVSSFNPVPSHYADFSIFHGEELFIYHRQVRDEVGGALSVLEQAGGLELVPTFGARAITSGGTLVAADFQRLADEFLEGERERPDRRPDNGDDDKGDNGSDGRGRRDEFRGVRRQQRDPAGDRGVGFVHPSVDPDCRSACSHQGDRRSTVQRKTATIHG